MHTKKENQNVYGAQKWHATKKQLREGKSFRISCHDGTIQKDVLNGTKKI